MAPKPLEKMSKDELASELRAWRASKDGRTTLARTIADLQVCEHEVMAQGAELAQARSALEESRDRYRDLYDFAPLAYVTLDPNGLIVEINLTGAKLLGLERRHLLGKPLMARVARGQRRIFLEHMRRCRKGESPVVSPLNLLTQSGEQIPVLLTTRPNVHAKLERLFFRTAVTDLTARNDAEQKLRHSEQMLQLAQSAAGAAAWDWDVDNQVLNWSQGVFRLFGADPQKVQPTLENFLKIVHPHDRPLVLEVLEQRLPEFHSEYRIIRPDGQTRWMGSYGRLLHDADGTGSHMIGITRDITESKLAQLRLEELNKELKRRSAQAEQRTGQLRAMAIKLAHTEQRERRRLAQVLHDHLQQLLFAAKMKMTMVRNGAGDADVRANVQQALELLGQAIAASRSLTAELSPAILHDMGLVAAIEWLARDAQEKHGLKVTVRADPDVVLQDADLNAVVFNALRELLFNTVKHAHARHAKIALKHVDPDHLQITVTDDGEGFDPAQLLAKPPPNAFGLSGIRERMEVMNAQFRIDSKPHQGTQVTLTLPRQAGRRDTARKTAPRPVAAPAQAPGAARLPPGPTPRQDKIRILLADDHDLVRKGLASLLEEQRDMQVVAEAGDGLTAVERVRRGDVDVVIMDLTMPVMNGIEATRRIVAQSPNVSIIGLSMHEQADMAAAMRQAGASAYFTKGGPPEELIETIRSVSATTVD